jgi:hypothetical protein
LSLALEVKEVAHAEAYPFGFVANGAYGGDFVRLGHLSKMRLGKAEQKQGIGDRSAIRHPVYGGRPGSDRLPDSCRQYRDRSRHTRQ